MILISHVEIEFTKRGELYKSVCLSVYVNDIRCTLLESKQTRLGTVTFFSVLRKGVTCLVVQGRGCAIDSNVE